MNVGLYCQIASIVRVLLSFYNVLFVFCAAITITSPEGSISFFQMHHQFAHDQCVCVCVCGILLSRNRKKWNLSYWKFAVCTNIKNVLYIIIAISTELKWFNRRHSWHFYALENFSTSRSYKRQDLATNRSHLRTIVDASTRYHRATWRTHDTKSTYSEIRRCPSTWNTNCTIRHFCLICASSRPAPSAMQTHRRECMNDTAHCSRSLRDVRPSQSAIYSDRVHSRRIFRWCSPCNWNSRMPNRIYSRDRVYRSIGRLYFLSICRYRTNRKCQPAFPKNERKWKKQKIIFQNYQNSKKNLKWSPEYISVVRVQIEDDHFGHRNSTQTRPLF